MFLFTFLMFVILLSTVVLFHELGHFLVGKYFKIGIEAFSVGFGRAIIKIRKGETDYRINWIPFGGYVKFVGEGPDEELDEDQKEKALNLRPPYQKALVVFAGPFMNMVLAFLIFSIMFLVGFPTKTTRIGYVAPDTPAFAAGLVPGDKILAVNDKPVWRWDDMSHEIEEFAGIETALTVDRGGEKLTVKVTPKAAPKMNILGITEDKGVIGVSENGMRPLLGLPARDSIAALAGLKTGDLLIKIDGKLIHFQQSMKRVLADGQPHSLEVVVNADQPEKDWTTKTVNLPASGGMGMESYGIEYADLYIHKVEDDSPAKTAGILAGDKILTVAGTPVYDWQPFSEMIQKSADKPLDFSVLRNGQPVDLQITPELKKEKDLMGETQSFGRIGIYRSVAFQPPELISERHLNPLKIMARGFDLSWYWSVITLKAFVYIFTGDVSPKAVGGPITIAVMAGETAKLGVFPFFLLMAIISLNLAVINLVPIPILDGGHIAFFMVEMVRGKPLSPIIMDVAARVGMVLLGLMVIFVLYNDFSRFSYNIMDMFSKMVNF